ncbi:MAG: bifunctional 4-hydroxy-3-methylbut-2-enyl diphosphate reductase/30S ribosomal protein S1, partial [Oscillospiraceae bacterium]
MKIELAKTAGFCYGVERAVSMAEQAAKSPNCVMLGAVIHNDHVVKKLQGMGVLCVEQAAEVPPGSTVILRSHGEGRAVYEALRAKGCTIVDTACPNVTKIHRIVEKAEQQGRLPVIIGTHDHPEVAAIAGWCENPTVLSGEEELASWLSEDVRRKELPLTFVSQTTAITARWEACIKIAKKECTNVEIFDTICTATY